MPNNVIELNDQYLTTAIVEDDKLFVHTTNFDDRALDQNERIRSSGILDKGKLGLHGDEDIRMAISCPSVVQWNTFKKKHYDTYKLITSRLEDERMKGCKQLQILEPAWVVMERL